MRKYLDFWVLFGFCHGQQATLEWMQILISQLVLSALIVRPGTILVMRALVPTACIETGLAQRETPREAACKVRPTDNKGNKSPGDEEKNSPGDKGKKSSAETRRAITALEIRHWKVVS